jgi:hypothetical protein
MSQLGYVRDVPWETTYHPCLNPHYTRFALRVSGVAVPAIRTCCELAYGQGLSITLHAACNSGTLWTGTDFNPGHVAFASRLTAGVKLANLRLHEEPVTSFCRRGHRESFDFVSTIGTWSWLSPSDQEAIGEFLKAKLRPEGLFCLDHMTLPGMNGMTELRRLMVTFAESERQGRIGDRFTREEVVNAVERTLDFLDLQPSFMQHHRRLLTSLKKMLVESSDSLIHEYFNYNWRPRYFLDTAQFLKRFGLSWAAPWSLDETSQDLHLTPRQQAYLSNFSDPIQREPLKDFVLNREARSDVWLQGATPRPSPNPNDDLRTERVILVRPKDDFTYRAEGTLGEMALSRGLYGRLLEALADHEPTSIAQLEETLSDRANFHELIDAVCILIEQQFLQVVNPSDSEIEHSSPASRAVNRNILEIGRRGQMLGHLGSPVTGGGIKVSCLNQLFLLAREEGARYPEQYASFAKDVLANMEVPNTGKNTDPDQINSEAEAFEARHLPIYRALNMTEAS